MQDITRNSYSLYKRKSGGRTVWYVRFWDDDFQTYSSGRSTGQTIEAVAHRVAQKWLAEGIPEAKKGNQKVSQKRMLSAITKYLEDAGVLDAERKYETGEILKLLYSHITNQQLSSTEGFIAYLLRFWDWNGDYVQGRLERKKSIGRKYVDDCRSIILRHIKPFFKDMALCDVTTFSLESFMKSIPRRDMDSQNGYSRRSINIMMKLIKKALKDAVRLGIIPRNPADNIELLADDTRGRGILSSVELQRLFQIEWADERGKIAAILAAVSGMRLGEIVALQCNDIDPDRNIIHLRHNYSAKEKRLKVPKSGKERIIYTDKTIVQMIVDLHSKNPYQGSYVFWGLEPDKPIRFETIEKYLEKALAALLGEEIQQAITADWQEAARILALSDGVHPDEIISAGKDTIDTTQNCIRIHHSYTFKNNTLIVLKEDKERIIPIKASVLQRITTLCRKEPYVFIFGGKESNNLISFENLKPNEEKRLTLLLGEIARRERNVSFHGFRHFFNSIIEGTVSDDILRLQTGHADEKMTDLYDHMTDDRGEQLRKAVQAKILPFIPKVAGE
jgi:integrase